MTNTLFDKIIRREIPADIVYEDSDIVAFRDIHPQAPVHILFVPRKSMATLNDAAPEDAALIGKLVLAAASFAKREGFAESGYRVVFNCNRDGGQAEAIPCPPASAGWRAAAFAFRLIWFAPTSAATRWSARNTPPPPGLAAVSATGK